MYNRSAHRQVRYSPESITITGGSAVGKDALVAMLKKSVQYKSYIYVSAGAIMRKFQESSGMTIEDFAQHCCERPEEDWDKKCDEEMSRLGLERRTISEGRLPHIFIPHAFHILLTCNLELRAIRRQQDAKYSHLPVEQVKDLLFRRDQIDRARYERLYPGCLWSNNEFDLVLPTDRYTVKEEVDIIYLEHHLWCEAKGLK